MIESSLTHFKAQSWERSCVPPFGSLVVIEQTSFVFYALVHQSFTGTDGAIYAVQAYGKTEQELKREQPQIFELLKTTFTALIIAYKQDNNIKYTCAPVPAQMHAFVREATDEEYTLFAHDHEYLSVLFGQAQHINIDELILAFLDILQQKKITTESDLIALLRTYALLCGNDYRRMRFLAQRLQ